MATFAAFLRCSQREESMGPGPSPSRPWWLCLHFPRITVGWEAKAAEKRPDSGQDSEAQAEAKEGGQWREGEEETGLTQNYVKMINTEKNSHQIQIGRRIYK